MRAVCLLICRIIFPTLCEASHKIRKNNLVNLLKFKMLIKPIYFRENIEVATAGNDDKRKKAAENIWDDLLEAER